MDLKINQEQLLSISTDPRINRLLNDVVSQLREYIEQQTQQLSELTRIGVALSATRNLNQLLEMIVDNARAFTNCDGGTLYMVNEEQGTLEFTIVQTESLGFRMGGITGGAITLPAVNLKVNGELNNANVCAYVANSGQLVNIPDVYEVDGFNFEGTRRFDALNHYRSQSMLVIPMRDHLGEIIGVLQLINARDRHSGATIPFSAEYQILTEALASQAAVAITNARLIREQQALFDAFIKTIAAAIDEKSPYTGGHIERVSNLTMEIARRINEANEGKFAATRFSDDEMEELRLAAWLHDTGKITTPEYVIDKRTKLETIFDREELVRIRIELAIANAQIKALKNGGGGAGDTDEAFEAVREQYEEDFAFITGSNFTAEFVSDEKIERLKAIAAKTVDTTIGPEPLLTENELYNLSIRKGNLTPEERKVIENHALMTIKLLERLPFPKRLRNVPAIAGAHHEKLNGRGYPLGLTAEQIPLQARIMALADVFEALTAKDRPYKQPKKMSEVLKILGYMVKDGELDADVVNFFLENKMHVEYAKQHLEPFQLDVE